MYDNKNKWALWEKVNKKWNKYFSWNFKDANWKDYLVIINEKGENQIEIGFYERKNNIDFKSFNPIVVTLNNSKNKEKKIWKLTVTLNWNTINLVVMKNLKLKTEKSPTYSLFEHKEIEKKEEKNKKENNLIDIDESAPFL